MERVSCCRRWYNYCVTGTVIRSILPCGANTRTDPDACSTLGLANTLAAGTASREYRMWHSALGAKTTDRFGMRMRRTDPLMPRRMLLVPEPAAGMDGGWPVDIACGMWHSARMAAHRSTSLELDGPAGIGKAEERTRTGGLRCKLGAG